MDDNIVPDFKETEMGNRSKRKIGKDGETNITITLSEQELNKLYTDAELIRNTFIDNNPDVDCMDSEQIYYFLLGVYIREETDGEYEIILNERLDYSRGQSQ